MNNDKLKLIIKKIFGVGIVFVIAIGLWLVGSPSNARKIQDDKECLATLNNIKYQIASYLRRKKSLPKTLSELDIKANNLSTMEYSDLSKDEKYKYRICVNFHFNYSKDGEVYNYSFYDLSGDDYRYTSGRNCFNFECEKDKDNSWYSCNYVAD